MKVRTFIFSSHRIIGTIVSLFFLMWFISGLVLLYYPFPNVSSAEKYKNMDVLPDSLPDIESVLDQVPGAEKKIRGLQVEYLQEQTLFTVKTKDSLYAVCGNSLQKVKPVTGTTITEVAKKWVDAPIARIDTLHERDIWIMYSRYLEEMPIYKFYFDDKDKHELYISARSAEVQQFTNKEQRFWAWVGSIPHKFYIPVLRKNTEAWVLSLTIGGTVALITALLGMYIGIYTLYTRYKAKRKLESPYKRSWYKWHHTAGLIFGISLITFAFSGAMSLQRIPQWVIKTHGDYRISDSKLRGKRLPIDHYLLDYRILKEKYPEIKRIEWSYFRDIPVYTIIDGDAEKCIDASSTEFRELYLPEAEIEKAITSVHGKEYPYTISLIDEYEEYYMSRKEQLPLPVYKVEVSNEDKSRYYIDPKTGSFKYLNKTRMVKKWVFSGLHYLNIKWLIDRPMLWTIAIWTLCLGGIIVSGSGVWLSVRYLKRKITRKHKKR